ncbi:YcjF family protein [Magnetococcales bacterium HHB-1]
MSTEETETQSKEEQANKVVFNYTLGSAAAGAIPSPALDLIAITGVQLKMLHSLSKIYDVEFMKEKGKKAISALLGGSIPVASKRTAASAIKVIPFVGHWLSLLTLPALSGASTYAVGKLFIQHFESGGTFLNFDAEAVRNHFKELMEEGKDVVKNNKDAKVVPPLKK